MTTSRQTLFWVGATLALFLFIALLREILLPFVVGAAIAYFLDPLADRLERAGISRLWATILIVVVFGLLVVLGVVFILPILLDQLIDLAAKLPGYFLYFRELASGYLNQWFGERWIEGQLGPDGSVKDIAEKVTLWVGKHLPSVLSGGLAIVNSLALVIITPVVTFYLLLDWDRMMADISSWLPRDHANTIHQIANDIDEVISGFVRGQITVLVILGIFYVVGLTLIGLNFGLLIGLGAGIVSFIPFVGAIVGLAIGGAVAVVQFWPEWHLVAAVLSVFLIGQAIEGNILSPMIVGDRVRLHPVWLMFALFVFGYLFGFVGMLLAVPAAAAIGVLVRFGLQIYLKSTLYKGTVRKGRKKT